MKPLNTNKLPELLTRIDQAINGELYSITMNNPQNFTVELSVQDKNRGYDWINIAFEIEGVSDAKLLEDKQLTLVDMSEGITLLHKASSILFAIGNYNSIESAKSAVMFLEGTSLKYEERPFQTH